MKKSLRSNMTKANTSKRQHNISVIMTEKSKQDNTRTYRTFGVTITNCTVFKNKIVYSDMVILSDDPKLFRLFLNQCSINSHFKIDKKSLENKQ